MKPVFSFILPVFNEEETLEETYRRLEGILDRLKDEGEIILVDDGSRDRSLDMMRDLRRRDPRVCYISLARNFGHQIAVTAGLRFARGDAVVRDLRRRDPRVCYISLARNFGHQIAVTAGLRFARGDAVVVLDADLQDPPELIPAMIDKWREGYHVVYAQRTARQREGPAKKLFAYLFYRCLRLLTKVDMPADTGDFCLMDRNVVDILNALPERGRYLRGLRAWVGFRQTAVPFQREPRFAPA